MVMTMIMIMPVIMISKKNALENVGHPCSIHIFNTMKLMIVIQVAVAERSNACTVFARTETGIVGSNSTQGIDV
jgi:hypothetical protein